MMFADRRDAGRALAALVALVGGDIDATAVVLGLPRGGVPVAAEVAAALGAALDVAVVRKLSRPSAAEFAFGAVGEGGVTVVDEELAARVGLDDAGVAALVADASAAVSERVDVLRGVRPRVPLCGRTAVVVDDGLATGSSMRAACLVVRAAGAARIVAAVPVAAPRRARALVDENVADEVIAVAQPADFRAVGRYYRDFRQTSDVEVIAMLGAAAARAGSPQGHAQ